MRKRGFLNELVTGFRKVDEVVYIASGTRLRFIAQRIWDAWDEDIKKATGGAHNTSAPPVDDPYRVLHCRPDDFDMVIRGRFRLLCKELHPDTGAHPDPAEFQRILEAYNTIMAERKAREAAPKGD